MRYFPLDALKDLLSDGALFGVVTAVRGNHVTVATPKGKREASHDGSLKAGDRCRLENGVAQRAPAAQQARRYAV